MVSPSSAGEASIARFEPSAVVARGVGRGTEQQRTVGGQRPAIGASRDLPGLRTERIERVEPAGLDADVVEAVQDEPAAVAVLGIVERARHRQAPLLLAGAKATARYEKAMAGSPVARPSPRREPASTRYLSSAPVGCGLAITLGLLLMTSPKIRPRGPAGGGVDLVQLAGRSRRSAGRACRRRARGRARRSSRCPTSTCGAFENLPDVQPPPMRAFQMTSRRRGAAQAVETPRRRTQEGRHLDAVTALRDGHRRRPTLPTPCPAPGDGELPSDKATTRMTTTARRMARAAARGERTAGDA